MASVRTLEERLGIFDLALSFAADGVDYSLLLTQFAEFYDVRCYHYQEYLVQQSGLDILQVADYIYATSSMNVVINTPLYGYSRMTKYELQIIAHSSGKVPFVVVEAGGGNLPLDSRDMGRYSDLNDEVAIQIMQLVAHPSSPGNSWD